MALLSETIGVPIKLLHKAVGEVVTCEIVTGDFYKGKLLAAEDNMNCHLRDVVITEKEGGQRVVETVFIRGSKIKLIILPAALNCATIFKSQSKELGDRKDESKRSSRSSSRSFHRGGESSRLTQRRSSSSDKRNRRSGGRYRRH